MSEVNQLQLLLREISPTVWRQVMVRSASPIKDPGPMDSGTLRIIG